MDTEKAYKIELQEAKITYYLYKEYDLTYSLTEKPKPWILRITNLYIKKRK
jgi:hypothetical protein